MKPPKRKNPTPKEWYEQNLKEGYSLTDNFSEQEVNDRIARGKYLTFYNPKIYKRNESGGYVNINYPDATVDSPEYGGEPVRSFKPDAIPQKYNALEPKVTIAPGHKPVEIGPSVTYNPNTGGYTNSVTQKIIDPTIVQQKAKGGLVNKVKGYAGGGLTGLDKKAAAAGFGVSGLGGAAQMAGELGSNLINDDPNEQGIVNTNKAAWSNSLSNAGKGAATGAAIGSIIPGVGTVIGGAAGALIGGIGGFIGGKNKAEAANEEVEKQIEEQKKAEFDAKAAESQRSALSQRMLENYAQGGKVEGKGTAKSDSIPAKVKEDSFVIPAENAPIAEAIRKKVLKAPVKKANLKQSGGEPVKLSDGEHLFTPKEVEELAAKGIDLNKLAPEAQSKLRDELNCGGKVKGYGNGGQVPSDSTRIADTYINNFKGKIHQKGDVLSKIQTGFYGLNQYMLNNGNSEEWKGMEGGEKYVKSHVVLSNDAARKLARSVASGNRSMMTIYDQLSPYDQERVDKMIQREKGYGDGGKVKKTPPPPGASAYKNEEDLGMIMPNSWIMSLAKRLDRGMGEGENIFDYNNKKSTADAQYSSLNEHDRARVNSILELRAKQIKDHGSSYGEGGKITKRKYSTGNKDFDKRVDEVSKKQYSNVDAIEKDVSELQAIQEKFQSLYGERSQEIDLAIQGLHKIKPDVAKGQKKSALISEIDKEISAARDQIVSSGATKEELARFEKGAQDYKRSGVDEALNKAVREISGNLAGRTAKESAAADKELLKTKGLSFYRQKLIDNTKKLEEAKLNPANYTRKQIDEFQKEIDFAKDKMVSVNDAIESGGMKLVAERDIFRKMANEPASPATAVKLGPSAPKKSTPPTVAEQEKFIIDPASPEIPTVKELDAYKASEAIKKSPGLAAPRRAATSGMNDTMTAENLPSVAATLPSAPADLELRTSPTVTDEQLAANPLGLDGTAPAAGGGSGSGGQKTDFGGLANQLINFGVPAIQTALGTKMLKEAGARPVDELDPDYLASIDAARNNLDLAKANAKFGFTPEEQALLNQENAAATSAARAAARNYSGGSAANAYNMEMNAINQGNQRGLAAKVQNRALMLQKQRDALAQQGYVDNLVTGKAQMNRALFGDEMNAWQQKQQAGGALTGAGLNNLVGAARYNQELDFMKGLANKYRV